MKPEDRKQIPVPARRSLSTRAAASAQKQAAADIVRGQIDAIFANDPHSSAPVAQSSNLAAVDSSLAAGNSAPSLAAQTSASAAPTQPQAQAQPQNANAAQNYPQPSGSVSETLNSQAQIVAGPGAVNHTQAQNLHNSQESPGSQNPYNRTMSQTPAQKTTDDSWQKYHTAWQSYYQQYYERYYTSQVHAAKQSLSQQAEKYRADLEKNAQSHSSDGALTQDEAVSELRSSIRQKINERAQKVRKSRHFMPIMAAVVVVLVFLFLQYNRVLFAYVEAYVSPGAMDSESIIVSPETASVASNESRLLIPKIAVDVPIVWDAVASDANSLNAAMDKGVVWFNIQGASAKPGEKGNFVVSGHSSNDWTDSGDYKFIFARLERIVEGDIVYANYNGTRYTYKITSTKVVKPTDVAALQIGNDKPYITLITCTPLGTATNRLLVFGEQISPNPDEATAAKSSNSSSTSQKMPSNSPTFLQRVFGLSN